MSQNFLTLQQTIFLIPIVTVGLAAAVHATAYLHGEARHHLPRFWLFFLVTLLAMIGVVFAPGKISFLLAWEAMGLMSAGLVAFENREKPVRKATWIYLLACHAGACMLMLAGVLLSRPDAFLAAFFCAVVGFGLKAGFPPFHVWLPEAHPAAPAPASAIMSGAMIPLGFFGLLKFFWPACTHAPHALIAGWTLLALGAAGALGGILFALPQNNLKRLLAFSSVENMGIVALALGLAVLAHQPSTDAAASVTSFAFAGALAHIINHAFLKGSLFLGAGSILRQTGTLNLDRLGGLMKRMPKTGTLMTLNALGLAGLPPLNGFLGELLIYAAAFHAIASGSPVLIGAGFLVLAALAFSGGLAAAAYCKALGGAFLGEPRTEAVASATETPRRMWIAQLALFVLSVLMIPGTILFAHMQTAGASTPLLVVAAGIGFAFVLLTGGLLALRRFVCPRGKIKPQVPTWDCGYHAPTARMAYTASAFTQPLTDFFAVQTNDRTLTSFWRPVFRFCARLFQRAHLLQNGSLHLYILLILISVVILLITAFAL